MTAVKIAALASGTALVGALLLAPPASGDDDDDDRPRRASSAVELSADLTALNDSGVTGEVEAKVNGTSIRKVAVEASGLTPEGAHAQHIHFSATARHECPTFMDDANKDFRLTVVDGVPAYGMIAVSLTTSGDTSPVSGLALDRMPVVTGGELDYKRRGITVDPTLATALRNGQGVVVLHGIDYNKSGAYDAALTGPSELNPNVPGEATDPVACGVLEHEDDD